MCVATDEPAYFFWELLEAWKKLFLVGFLVLILPGTIPQLVIAFLFSLIFMLLVSTAQPFHGARIAGKVEGDAHSAAPHRARRVCKKGEFRGDSHSIASHRARRVACVQRGPIKEQLSPPPRAPQIKAMITLQRRATLR